MEKLKGQPKFKHGREVKTGILLCNLGTPSNPDKKNVKKIFETIFIRPEGCRITKNSLVADSQRHYPKYPAKKIRTCIRENMDRKRLPSSFL